MSDGLVVVDKPGGLTSHDVVARVRRLAGTRKVGHAGTLDPMATGVLVLGTGRATRLLGHLMLTEKAYDATIRLGVSTVTDDAEGDVLTVAPVDGIDEEQVREALARFVGDIEQVPTAVSAVKVDGKRSYQRVREGEEVALEARPVTIHELTVGAVRRSSGEGPASVDVDVALRCSSGTYVRAIARDLGAALGVGGHLTALRRTAVGPYRLPDARTLDQLAEEFSVMPLADAARAAFPSYDLDAEQAQAVRYGRPLPLELDILTAVFAPDGEFLALYAPRDGAARAVAVFVG
ncbi:tRNA pseudouridine(55) synthase TruB [Nocardioides sp. HM23]|uniref:tRNA pseudouridine(55) synthase TruB n=1 Tax=Nocardioides bizhenqiangii TaxID=3095076 RepID=UPI002ACA5B8D|nr:tRNA pseudouridine(55) synthase TruB [Nocardioides sp. HM23]MDZ5620764.1 tRNA pseudouridine(55) synthase TruB [Nocardioides sp. HM23]